MRSRRAIAVLLAVGGLFAAPLILPRPAPIVPREVAPFESRPSRTTDAGFPVRFRQKVIRLGQIWTGDTLRRCYDESVVAYVRMHAERAYEGKWLASLAQIERVAMALHVICDSESLAESFRRVALTGLIALHMQTFDEGNLREWAWLMQSGHAGWRSLEDATNRGFTARNYWDTWTGRDTQLATWMLGPLGFAVYTVDAGEFYLDGTGGNDGNAGTSQGAAKKTMAAAYALLTMGHSDILFVKYGTSYTNERIGSHVITGVDANHPLVICAYGTPSAGRPVFDTQNTSFCALQNGSHYFHIQSIAARSSTFTGSVNFPSGITGVGAVHDIRVENCVLHHLEAGISVIENGVGGNPSNWTIRRNYCYRCYSVTNGQAGVGIFFGGSTGGLVAEENVLWHNGWNTEEVPAASPNQFRHNTYFHQSNAGDAIIRRNYSDEPSDNGIARCTGTVEMNFSSAACSGVRSIANSAATPRNNGIVRKNVVIDGISRLTTDPNTTITSAWGYELQDLDGALVEDNLAARCVFNDPTTSARAMFARTAATASAGTIDLKDNVLHDWDNAFYRNSALLVIQNFSVGFSYNVRGGTFSQPRSGWLIEIQRTYGGTGFSFGSTPNRYFAANPFNGTPFSALDSGGMDYTGWRSVPQIREQSGAGAYAPIAFTDPTRSQATYEASLGGTATKAAYLTRITSFREDAWTEANHGVIPLLNHIREGFDMEAIPLQYEEPDNVQDATPVIQGGWPTAIAPAPSRKAAWLADGSWGAPDAGAGGVQRYTETLAAGADPEVYTVTHNLGVERPQVTLWEEGGMKVPDDSGTFNVETIDENSLRVIFMSPTTMDYDVVVVG